MSTTKHTAEPWYHVYHRGGSYVTDSPLPESGKWSGNTIATEATNIRAVADHARIVACVNACAGVDDPAEMRRGWANLVGYVYGTLPMGEHRDALREIIRRAGMVTG